MAKVKEKSTKEALREVIDKVWPKTKVELEKGLEQAKILLAKGEVHAKDLSKKGVKQTKKMSLRLKKEKVFYDLGKEVARTAANKWTTSKKIKALAEKVKALDADIANIK